MAKPARFGSTDLLLLLTVLIWGINFTSVKHGSLAMTPLAFTWLRILLAMITLLLFVLFRQRQWPGVRDVVQLLLLGVVGNGFYQLLFVSGVARTRVADAALLMAASPVLIALMGHMRGVERMQARAMAGVGLSIAGAATIILGSTRFAPDNGSLWGILLIILAVVCWSVFTIWLRPIMERVDAVQVNAITMVGGFIPMIFLTPQALSGVVWESLSLKTWIAIFYSSVISMGVAYLFWFRGVRVIGPTRTSTYINLQPLVAILFAWIALGELPTLWQIGGAITIILGIWIART